MVNDPEGRTMVTRGKHPKGAQPRDKQASSNQHPEGVPQVAYYKTIKSLIFSIG